MGNTPWLDYDKKQMQVDLFQAMQSRPGKYSGRALGNSSNIPLWTKDKVDSLWEGIATAYVRFFKKEFRSLRDFGRLIICEGMQESTGIWNLGCKTVDFDDHTSHGFIQVTPGSNMKDFSDWGTSIRSVLKNRSDKILLDPSKVKDMNTADPCMNILMFAWYTKNCVNMGVSMNEYAHRELWHIPKQEGHSKVYAACQAVWLAGPRTYINTDAGWKSYEDYYNRILDYFTQSGFGTKEYFDSLVYTTIVNELLNVRPEVSEGSAQ